MILICRVHVCPAAKKAGFSYTINELVARLIKSLMVIREFSMTNPIRSFLKGSALALTLAVYSGNLWATMQVDNMIVHFQPGDPSRKEVKVTNPDREPLYIQVELKEVLNPGLPNEVKKPVTNPKEAGLLVTPNKMAIQPGGEQVVRIVNLKGLKDVERIFRLTLKPVAGDIEAEQTGVKILIGYELLVTVQPIAPKFEITPSRNGNKLVLENTGNINVNLSKGTQCKDAEKSECVDLPSYRLYAGNKVELDLKYTTPVNYFATTGMNTQVVQY